MLPLVIWFLIAIGIVLLLILLSKLLAHVITITEDDHDFINPSQQIIGLIYGVLLAFVLVLSWQNYTDLNKSIQDETTGLLTLWRDSELFQKDTHQNVQNAILNYAQSVKEVEWPKMSHSEMVTYNPAYVNLWHVIQTIDPQTKIQEIVLSTSITELNEINKARRARLASATAGIPTALWIFLIGSACYIIGLTLLYKGTHMHLRTCIAFIQALIITSALYLITNFNHPFEGVLAISDTPFTVIATTIDDPDRLHSR